MSKKKNYIALSLQNTVFKSGISWEELEDDEDIPKVAIAHIRTQLPSAPRAVRNEEFVASLPEEGPFRLRISNVAYNVNEKNVEEFFYPLKVLSVYLCQDRNSSSLSSNRHRGFGFVEFRTREELSESLQYSGRNLSGRPVHIDVDRGDGAGPGGDAMPTNSNHRTHLREQSNTFDKARSGASNPQADSVDNWRSGMRPISMMMSSHNNPMNTFAASSIERQRRQQQQQQTNPSSLKSESRPSFPPQHSSFWGSSSSSSAPIPKSTTTPAFSSLRQSSFPKSNESSGDPEPPAKHSTMTEAEATQAHKERVPIKLEPRTVTVPPASAENVPRSSSIFGAAKPVDTTLKEMEAEKKFEEEKEGCLRGMEVKHHEGSSVSDAGPTTPPSSRAYIRNVPRVSGTGGSRSRFTSSSSAASLSTAVPELHHRGMPPRASSSGTGGDEMPVMSGQHLTDMESVFKEDEETATEVERGSSNASSFPALTSSVSAPLRILTRSTANPAGKSTSTNTAAAAAAAAAAPGLGSTPVRVVTPAPPPAQNAWLSNKKLFTSTSTTNNNNVITTTNSNNNIETPKKSSPPSLEGARNGTPSARVEAADKAAQSQGNSLYSSGFTQPNISYSRVAQSKLPQTTAFLNLSATAAAAHTQPTVASVEEVGYDAGEQDVSVMKETSSEILEEEIADNRATEKKASEESSNTMVVSSSVSGTEVIRTVTTVTARPRPKANVSVKTGQFLTDDGIPLGPAVQLPPSQPSHHYTSPVTAGDNSQRGSNRRRGGGGGGGNFSTSAASRGGMRRNAPHHSNHFTASAHDNNNSIVVSATHTEGDYQQAATMNSFESGNRSYRSYRRGGGSNYNSRSHRGSGNRGGGRGGGRFGGCNFGKHSGPPQATAGLLPSGPALLSSGNFVNLPAPYMDNLLSGSGMEQLLHSSSCHLPHGLHVHHWEMHEDNSGNVMSTQATNISMEQEVVAEAN